MLRCTIIKLYLVHCSIGSQPAGFSGFLDHPGAAEKKRPASRHRRWVGRISQYRRSNSRNVARILASRKPACRDQTADTSVARVHQHGACIADNNQQDMGRSRGGLTSKIHAVVDTNGLPVHLALTPGEVHDNRLCLVLLSALLPQTMLLADRGYDADWIRALAR